MIISQDKIKKYSKISKKYILIKDIIASKIKHVASKVNIQKIKKYAKIPRNFILVGCMVGLIVTSPGLKVNAQAIEPATSNTGYYELSEDGYSLYATGNVDFSLINNADSFKEVLISNSNIDENFSIENSENVFLAFENCNFSSADLQNVDSVTSLEFDNCNFDDLEILKNFKNVTNLTFRSCEIGSIKGIENVKTVEQLSFYSVGIESIEGIEKLDSLSILALESTCVKDLTPISNLNINVLDISNSPNIKDLTPIMSLKELNTIFLYNCYMAYTPELINYLNNNGIEHHLSYEDIEIKNQVIEIANKIISNDMTTDQKINAIVNYVVDNIEFDYDVYVDADLSLEYNNNALKHALNGIGCCKNYTALTTALMNIAGIDVYEIKSDTHIWNLIVIEDEYYWIDPTWLDGLEDVEILQSEYYMNPNDDFLDHDNLTIPSSMYNDINGIDVNNYTGINNITDNNDVNETSHTNEEKNYNTKNDITNIFKTKKASAGAIVGILIALGAAKIAYKKKEETNKRKTM